MFSTGNTSTLKGIKVSYANVVRCIVNTVVLYKPYHNDPFSQLELLSFDFFLHNLFAS